MSGRMVTGADEAIASELQLKTGSHRPFPQLN